MPAGIIGRATLPTNYVDLAGIATAQLRLPAPQPGYFFAMSAMAGRLTLEAINAGATTVQQFVSEMAGGAQIPTDLARLVTIADNYPELVKTVNEFGKNKGDTVSFYRDVYSTGGLTEAARQLTTNGTISTTGQTIGEEEVRLTLAEYNGPYASDGTAVAPYVIADFDAKYKANKEALASKVSRHLRKDYTHWLDTIVRNTFCSGGTITLSDTSLATVASYIVGGNKGFTWETIERARKAIVDRYWQPFDSGRYVLLVPTQFKIDMAHDVEYRQQTATAGDGRNQVYGYIKSIGDVDIIEVNTLPQWTNADGALTGNINTSAGAAVGTVGAGVTIEEALLIGPGAVGFGTALNPEVRFADDTDYGRKARCIWYSIQTLGKVDVRGIQRILVQSV